MSAPQLFTNDGSGWRQVSGDPIELPAEVFARADAFFDAADGGTLDVSDFVTMDELRARVDERRAGAAGSAEGTTSAESG